MWTVAYQGEPTRPDAGYLDDPSSMLVGEAQLADFDGTFSWGAQPGQATAKIVADIGGPAGSIRAVPRIAEGAYVQLRSIAGHVFHGVCKSAQPLDSSSGKEIRYTFYDLRMYLDFDGVRGAFNIPDSDSVPITGGVIRKRRFRHLLPVNWATGVWTWTDAPYTAAQVINFLLGAPTIGSPWLANVPEYHPAMLTTPVYEIDFGDGTKLDQALVAVSEKLGMVFTLVDFYKLRWRRKGELILSGFSADPAMPWTGGTSGIPASPFPLGPGGWYVFPPHADNCRDGGSLGEAPTRAYVTGARNLYQVMNLTLVPDWAPGWTALGVFEVFQDWLYLNARVPGQTYTYAQRHLNVGDDPKNEVGSAMAREAALRMTVRQFVALRSVAPYNDGAAFADRRRVNGRLRMDMPVALYLRTLVWRAWRLPDTVLGRPAANWKIEERLLVGVTHDATGFLTPSIDEPVDGNGYAVAQMVMGLDSSTVRGAINSNLFNFAAWTAAQGAWQVAGFQADSGSGDQVPFIVFDHPVFRDTSKVVMQDGLPVVTYGMPAVPTVRASLVLGGERFETSYGSASKDTFLSEQALYRELVVSNTGVLLGEVGYADGQTPVQKAQALAAAAITGQIVFRRGGFDRPMSGDSGVVVLNGLIDRVSFRSGPGGNREEVEFTTEWSPTGFNGERIYDRSRRDVNLYSGQEAVRAEIRVQQRIVQALRSGLRIESLDPDDVLLDLTGSRPDGRVVFEPAAIGTALPAGTPVWRDPASRTVPLPAGATAPDMVWEGVTVLHGQPAGAGVPVRRTSPFKALVRGPVAVNDSVGRSSGHGYLEKDGTPSVGMAHAAVPDGETRLIEVRAGGGSGGSDGFFFA